uniref:BEACH domain-containing protein n=1 Tax=Anopheles culicifacies TaxID=139723 RepID=A0A182MKP7_9DIPT
MRLEMRQEMENSFVKESEASWIDLIFGFKQQGQAAISAVNVFHHLFYEGNVDIYNIEDPLQKNAAIGFINNFGQIPKQLFRKQHPAKRMTPPKQFSMLVDVSPLIPPQSPIGGTPAINYEKIFFYHLTNLKSSQQPIKGLQERILPCLPLAALVMVMSLLQIATRDAGAALGRPGLRFTHGSTSFSDSDISCSTTMVEPETTEVREEKGNNLP